MVKKITILFLMTGSLVAGSVEAWNDKKTHPDLSEMAANKSAMVNKRLNDLNVVKGYENIDGKRVFRWLRDGSRLEDAGTNWDTITNHGRFNNHFHRPLKTGMRRVLRACRLSHLRLQWRT